VRTLEVCSRADYDGPLWFPQGGLAGPIPAARRNRLMADNGPDDGEGPVSLFSFGPAHGGGGLLSICMVALPSDFFNPIVRKSSTRSSAVHTS